MARKRDEARFEARRQEILRAAEKLFAEKGFHQTGMAELCRAVGMSPGALYRYFPSKGEIIRALVEEEQAETTALFDQLAEAKDFGRELLEALMAMIRQVGDPHYSRLTLEIAAEAARDETIAEIVRGSSRDAHKAFAALIRQAQRRGQADKAIDPTQTATVLLMLIDGATGFADTYGKVDFKKLKATLKRLVYGLLWPKI